MEPDAAVTTGGVSMKSSTEVSLSGSFAKASAVPREVGFYYGTSSYSMNNKVVASSSPSGTEGTFSVSLTGLVPSQTYYYRAYVTVSGTGEYASDEETIQASSYGTFTLSEDGEQSGEPSGWLELPALVAGDNQVVNTYYAGSSRNYTHLYDKNTFASLWTAYPLYASTTGGKRSESWAANPKIPVSDQINIWNGSYGVNYGSTIYARGHQIPDADRSNNSTMQAQTYYATNLVPQIQDNFNGGIWMNLESALRSAIPASDTLYVVTGVTFKTVGGNENVTYIQPKHDSKKCPVPNYFWKVIMKVKRSAGVVTSASTVGFWFEHKQYSDSYTNYAVSVDRIEQLTGFDFFANLPDGVEASAETNALWTAFQNF
jgi:endonuclease G